MGRKIVMVSDVSGQEAEESQMVKVVVREHPKLSEPKQLDIIGGELDGLKPLTDLVVLEVGENGSKFELVVSYGEFKKLIDDKVVENAPGTRGRRPGFSPNKG